MKYFLTLLTLLLAVFGPLNAAQLRPASLFADHMVLQRERPVPVWGWANPGESVTIEFGGQTKVGTADKEGEWRANLDPMPASSEPRVMFIKSSVGHEQSKIEDVLVGDVWVTSGQSNMGFQVKAALNAEQEIAKAQFPAIRLFKVTAIPALTPANVVKGNWQPCSPQTAGNFSAVSYFFGRELHQQLKVPIGLLNSSLGGTPAEAWTALEALSRNPVLGERAKAEIAQIKSQAEDNQRFLRERDAWEQKYGVKRRDISEEARGWADPQLDTGDWKTVTLPARWNALGAKSGGVFWLRKEFVVAEAAAGKSFNLSLLWIGEQYDTAYLNGVEVGHTGDTPPGFYNVQRLYNVPKNLVKVGRNVLAVRVVSATEKAGVTQWGPQLGLPVVDKLAVDNQWLMKTERTFPPLPREALPSRPKANTMVLRGVSSSLYNGMIAPLMPFAIKGAIWYQGEANTPRHTEYRELLSLMIHDWRAQWGQGDFPFLIQQLVNNGPSTEDPNRTEPWPFLREAQVQVSEIVPNCGIAVGIELGSASTIHPPNKQDVGKRLALVALEKTYGQKIESSGPFFESFKTEGPFIRVKFAHAQGLQAKGGPLKRFAIAGSDKKFVWANAKIEGDIVVVSSPQVTAPVAVRYAWTNNPEGCNLYNGAGLSASPFRTDSW